MWGREEEEEEADRVGHAQASWEMFGSGNGRTMSCLPGAASSGCSDVCYVWPRRGVWGRATWKGLPYAEVLHQQPMTPAPFDLYCVCMYELQFDMQALCD